MGAVARTDVVHTGPVLFVDGVRRIDARAWISDETGDEVATSATPALCASYAAGVMCCCDGRSHLLAHGVRHRLVTLVGHAQDVVTSAGTYTTLRTSAAPEVGELAALSNAVQQDLSKLEVVTAINARAALDDHTAGDDLLVVDGPLKGRDHLDRILGFVKTHQARYLPLDLHASVGALAAGERTPVFKVVTSWDRYTWYLRLPGRPGQPWAGVVRIECPTAVREVDAIRLANLSQAVLPRFASVEYKDSRAPQNLFPIAGLERELRRRLGDNRVLYRALLAAAAA